MKIKAAVVPEAKSPFVIEEIELDEPRANEVLVTNCQHRALPYGPGGPHGISADAASGRIGA